MEASGELLELLRHVSVTNRHEGGHIQGERGAQKVGHVSIRRGRESNGCTIHSAAMANLVPLKPVEVTHLDADVLEVAEHGLQVSAVGVPDVGHEPGGDDEGAVELAEQAGEQKGRDTLEAPQPLEVPPLPVEA